MRWVSARWGHFWFEPTSPTNLGLCRVLFFGALFLIYLAHDFVAWASVSHVFWQPIWAFQRFHLPLLPGELLSILQIGWKAALALSCIGFCTCFSTAVAFILGAYLLGLPYNFGTTSHQDAILVLVFGSMALSRCGDGVSVDALLRRARRDSDPVGRGPVISGEYTWPVRMVWLLMALAFFAAGVAKIRFSGLQWVTSDTLANFLILNNYPISNFDPLTTWGLYLAQHPWLCRMLAAGTIGVEVGFPLVLVSPGARRLLVPATLLLQIMIRVVLGPSFVQFMLCYLFWVPWDGVAGWLAARLRQERKLTIFVPAVAPLAEVAKRWPVSAGAKEKA